MSSKNDGGDKTEKPTPKRLKDARKKGDVAKSRDLTSAAGLVLWLALAAMITGFAITRVTALYDLLFATIGTGWVAIGFASAARNIGWQAGELVMMLVAITLGPAAVIGLLTEFLQAGPILTFEKVKPNLAGMNPVEGMKRMFSMDNLIEVLKAVVKTALLLTVGWMIVKGSLPDIMGLSRSASLPPGTVGQLISHLTIRTLAWSVALFALVALLDWVYQRHSFEKKNRMSMRDIKQEYKESEGDPHIKQHRKEAHQEWSQRNAANATRNANVLLVNPTRVAIAIDYDKETTPVPVISAKGEDEVAGAMRAAATEAGVPIVRNIALARELLARGEIGEIIPEDLFDIIAEVILWAREVRAQLDADRRGEASGEAVLRRAAPGEDLTQYH